MRLTLAPVTFTRRIGAACETAQKLAELRQPSASPAAYWMVRLDSERQKFTSAMQFAGAPSGTGRHWL